MDFKFEMNQKVSKHGKTGQVIARTQHAHGENVYLVHFDDEDESVNESELVGEPVGPGQ